MKTFKIFAVLVSFLSLSSAFGAVPSQGEVNAVVNRALFLTNTPMSVEEGYTGGEGVAKQQLQETESKRVEDDVVLLD